MTPFLQQIPIVDAHHHLWQLAGDHYPKFVGPPRDFFLGDYSALRHEFMPDDYRRAAAGHNVVATVHVEAEWRRDDQAAETERVADAHGLPDVMVGHAWFDDPQVERVLEAHARYARMRGIRSKPALPGRPADDEEGRGSMSDPAWRRGYALLSKYGLSWDLRVPHSQLPEAAALVSAYPDIPVVLNHTGFPWDRSEAGLAAWRADMRQIAGVPHVHLKLSELGLKDRAWDYDENRRIVLEAIELFGVGRCMFASNFPVAGLRIGFDELYTAYKNMVTDFTEAEQHGRADTTRASVQMPDGRVERHGEGHPGEIRNQQPPRHGIDAEERRDGGCDEQPQHDDLDQRGSHCLECEEQGRPPKVENKLHGEQAEGHRAQRMGPASPHPPGSHRHDHVEHRPHGSEQPVGRIERRFSKGLIPAIHRHRREPAGRTVDQNRDGDETRQGLPVTVRGRRDRRIR